MRTVSFIFKEENREKVCAMLDEYCSYSFVRDDGTRQWNCDLEEGGTFYMSLDEYYIAPLAEELRELPIDEYVYLITDKSGGTYTSVQYPETAEKILSMGRFVIVSVDIPVSIEEPAPEVYFMAEEFLSKVSGYACDDYSERLWSVDEIKELATYKGHLFFDYDGWREEHEEGGPFALFGIVGQVDHMLDYGACDVNDFVTIGMQEEAIDCWYPDITELRTFFYRLSQPAKGLARLGVTLIPPESLAEFYRIADERTELVFENKRELLTMISSAIQGNKYMIHIGF